MKANALCLLTLLLVLPVFVDGRVLAANASPIQSDQADEGVDPDMLFPLAKRNGLRMEAIVTPLSQLGKGVTNTQFVATFKDGNNTLKQVVEHPATANGIQLAVAAYMTYRAGDLEEAAFLFYESRLRFYYDLERYEPVALGSGLSDVKWFLSLLIESVKRPLIRDLYMQPEVFAKVVRRIEAFDLQTPTEYDPGWDYTLRDVPTNLPSQYKMEMVETMKPIAQLLAMPEYFEAFRVLRACNDLPLDRQEDLIIVARRTKAEETMRRIEDSKNLHGIIYQSKNTKE